MYWVLSIPDLDWHLHKINSRHFISEIYSRVTCRTPWPRSIRTSTDFHGLSAQSVRSCAADSQLTQSVKSSQSTLFMLKT